MRSFAGVGSGVGEAVVGELTSSGAGVGCASGTSATEVSEAFADSFSELLVSCLLGQVRELCPN